MNPEPSTPPPDYERSDAHPRLVVGIGAFLFALIGIGVVVGHLLLPSDRYPARTGGLPTTGSGPTDAADLQRAWADQDRIVHDRLERYEWVDRSQGIVRIPIEEAMQLQAQKEAAP